MYESLDDVDGTAARQFANSGGILVQNRRLALQAASSLIERPLIHNSDRTRSVLI
jgi:hypothetical protein